MTDSNFALKTNTLEAGNPIERPLDTQTEKLLADVKHYHPRMIELVGIPGSGRREMVHALGREFSDSYPVLIHFDSLDPNFVEIMSDPLLWLEYTFTQLVNLHPEADRGQFHESINAFRQRDDLPEDIARDYADMARRDRLNPDHQVPWLKAFISLYNEVFSWESDEKAAILFDSIEGIGFETIDFLEQFVFKQVVRKVGLVVWPGNRRYRWKTLDVKRHLYTKELQNLSEHETVTQIKSNLPAGLEISDEFLRQIYAITGGYPYANELALKKLSRLTEAIVPASIDNSAFLDELKEFVYNGFVKEYLEAENPRVQRAVELLSLVPYFDMSLLSSLIEVAESEKDELFGFVKRSRFIVWDDVASSYAVHPAIRHIISQYYEVHQPDIFKSINRKAVSFFGELSVNPNVTIPKRELFKDTEAHHKAILARLKEDHD